MQGSVDDKGQSCKLDSISRQREADGSSEAAGEGEAGEKCTCEEGSLCETVEGTPDLVSWCVRLSFDGFWSNEREKQGLTEQRGTK